jgi:hypothetical protein
MRDPRANEGAGQGGDNNAEVEAVHNRLPPARQHNPADTINGDAIPRRHYCRNPRCRMKLAAPVETERRAFCTRGCHATFYRQRCLVCEKPFAGGRESRRFCRGNKCAAEHRRNPEIYRFWGIVPPNQVKASERPVKWAFKSCARTGRGWHWEESGGEHWLLNRENEVQARLVPASERYIVWLSPGIDYGVPSPLEDARRLAISLALARLPLEQYAKHLARINEIPPDPPQYLLPFTGAYLAGLQALRAANEKPVRPAALPPEGDPLEIPSFLRRTAASEAAL